jgi:hypothetical protein
LDPLLEICDLHDSEWPGCRTGLKRSQLYAPLMVEIEVYVERAGSHKARGGRMRSERNIMPIPLPFFS